MLRRFALNFSGSYRLLYLASWHTASSSCPLRRSFARNLAHPVLPGVQRYSQSINTPLKRFVLRTGRIGHEIVSRTSLWIPGLPSCRTVIRNYPYAISTKSHRKPSPDRFKSHFFQKASFLFYLRKTLWSRIDVLKKEGARHNSTCQRFFYVFAMRRSNSNTAVVCGIPGNVGLGVGQVFDRGDRQGV